MNRSTPHREPETRGGFATIGTIQRIDGWHVWFTMGVQSFFVAVSENTEDMANWYLTNLETAFRNQGIRTSRSKKTPYG